MAKTFQGKNGGAPFPRTESEWVEKKMQQGVSFEDASKFADHKMCQDVFGHDYKIDAKGFPIETGIGSAANPGDSDRVKRAEADAMAQAKMRLGWHKGLETAFDPRAGA
jgi:hypothetical protein